MTGPIHSGTGVRTDLDTLPVEGSESGVDHSRLEWVPDRGGRLFLVAALGAAPQAFAELALPLTRGAVQLADARGFAGIAFEARGSGRYSLLVDSYGVRSRSRFRAAFDANAARREIRIPFSALRSPDPDAALDLAALRALAIRLQGEPGGNAWLELGRVRFY